MRNFSFDVSLGDKINISGRSGIGKTTLFKLLLGFDSPDEGKIYFQDSELNDSAVWDVRKKVAYVSQDLNIGHGKVISLFNETLNYKANLHQKTKAEKEIRNKLIFFELPENILDKNIEELSGGEKQRIAIINSLLLNRNIFFLDEVTSALDIINKKKVLDYFLGEPDFTVLYISHDDYLPENANVQILKLDRDE
ncbi:MAG TPA: ATP-binding cassette domain-containing protein [Paludibacter sp.]|nr:ATP-binding cassette domain-containing protein [Paludibacter sp.]